MCTCRIKSASIRNRDTIPRPVWSGSACPQLYDRPKKETARPAERNIESRPENTSEYKGLTGSRVIYDPEGYWAATQDNLRDSQKNTKIRGSRQIELECDKTEGIIPRTREYEKIYVSFRDILAIECYRYSVRYESRRLNQGGCRLEAISAEVRKVDRKNSHIGRHKGRQNDVLSFMSSIGVTMTTDKSGSNLNFPTREVEISQVNV